MYSNKQYIYLMRMGASARRRRKRRRGSLFKIIGGGGGGLGSHNEFSV
jgi:hypothetical protein